MKDNERLESVPTEKVAKPMAQDTLVSKQMSEDSGCYIKKHNNFR